MLVTTGCKQGDVLADFYKVDPWSDVMPPTSYYGTEHVICPHVTRTTGYLLKIVGKGKVEHGNNSSVLSGQQ